MLGFDKWFSTCTRVPTRSCPIDFTPPPISITMMYSSMRLIQLLFFVFPSLQALNDLCEGQGWGIEVICGHIGEVTVNIPYEAPLAKDSSIEVKNLSISLRPKARVTDGTSMFESMWSSMSSSMQLAQECLEREGGCAESPSAAPTNTIEGLEKFAQIIDNGKWRCTRLGKVIVFSTVL